jgi:hypothetical protein
VLAKWAFGLRDVSSSSARTWSTHRITQATNNSKYGDNSDWEWLLAQKPIDLNLDGVWFRLCGIQTRQTKLTLTFEDRAASLLREHKGLKTATRGSVTRAEFVKMLCGEVKRYGGVPVFIPELNVVQPVEESKDSSETKLTGGAGLSAHQVTVKHVPATEAQVKVLNLALQAAEALKAPYKAQVALVEALIQENNCSNPDPGNAEDAGCLSMIESTVKSTKLNPYDVAEVCTYFLTTGFFGNGGAIAIAQGNPNFSADEVAQATQGSAFPKAYGQWDTEAQKIVRTYYGSGGGANTAYNPAAYQFTRGVNETSWDCIQRLAAEVQWYAFVRENVLWYVSGNYLYAQEPQLTIEQGKEGIEYVDVNIDIGARDNTAQVEVEAHADLWTALPGMIGRVTKRGPADGKWAVETAKVNLLDESKVSEITLEKPLPARAEPSTSETKATTFGESESALAVYNAYKALSAMELPYLWGGGHGQGALSNVHKGGPGLDCSGATCWALHQGGMFQSDTAETSGELAASWGEPGEGNEMTVWANSVHVYIEFKIPGQPHSRGDTVGAAGPRLQPIWPPPEGTSGFTPRHWPNT